MVDDLADRFRYQTTPERHRVQPSIFIILNPLLSELSLFSSNDEDDADWGSFTGYHRLYWHMEYLPFLHPLFATEIFKCICFEFGFLNLRSSLSLLLCNLFVEHGRGLGHMLVSLLPFCFPRQQLMHTLYCLCRSHSLSCKLIKMNKNELLKI